ncbi:MAG: HAD hydrolase-like protein [Actinobacteria bacterium]|nr:HAD hydrolase-like protein [Actinomycetota bacterium]
MNLRGLIFDLDGTLADTIPICVKAFQHTLNAHSGPRLSREEIESLFGPTEEGMLQRVLPEYSPVALETYLTEYERLHSASTLPFDGIAPLLDSLQSRGVRLAVVTGKGSRSAEISCRALGVRSYFTHIEAGSPNGVSKPAAITRVVGEWSLRPPGVAYIGDAAADVDAARSAGVVSVGAAWTPAASHSLLQAARPDFLFWTVPDFAFWVGEAIDAV